MSSLRKEARDILSMSNEITRLREELHTIKELYIDRGVELRLAESRLETALEAITELTYLSDSIRHIDGRRVTATEYAEEKIKQIEEMK